MRKSRTRWHHVAILVLGAALIPVSGCSSSVLNIAYYVFSGLMSVADAAVTGTTNTTTTTGS